MPTSHTALVFELGELGLHRQRGHGDLASSGEKIVILALIRILTGRPNFLKSYHETHVELPADLRGHKQCWITVQVTHDVHDVGVEDGVIVSLVCEQKRIVNWLDVVLEQ